MAIRMIPKTEPADWVNPKPVARPEYEKTVKALTNLIPAKSPTNRPGRPPSGKVVVTLRLSPDVIAKFKATGKGWQARIDAALRNTTPRPD